MTPMATFLKKLSMEDKVLYLAVFLFVVIGSYIGIKKDIPANDKEAMIEVQVRTDLPIGTDLKDVVAYLDRDKILHEDFDKRNHSLLAVFPNIEKGLFVKRDIHVVFRFNEKNKLASCTFQETLTGLRD